MPEVTGPASAPNDLEADGTFQAWDELLTRLEEDVAAGKASALSAEDPVRWTAPAGLGPLPASLADRAYGIVLAQKAALAELQNERRAVGKHLGALHSVSGSRQRSQPVYLDVTG